MSAAGELEMRRALRRYRIQRDIEEEMATREVVTLTADSCAMTVVRSWAERLSDADLGRLCRRLIGEIDAEALRRAVAERAEPGADAGAMGVGWVVAVAAFLLGLAALVALFAGGPGWLPIAFALPGLGCWYASRRIEGVRR